MLHVKNTAASFTGIFVLSGCALLPTASDKFETPKGVVAAQVFDCADKEISSLKTQNHLWDPRIKSLSTNNEIYETDNYRHHNTVGIFTQIHFNPTKRKGEITIRATGPYFVDLGAERELQLLKRQLMQCLKNKNL